MAKVKGIFFTFSSFFLAMLVVTLAILLSTTLKQSNSRLIESGSLERVYLLDFSLERVIRKIDNGITASLDFGSSPNDTILIISENLTTSFNNYSNNFLAEMDELASFTSTDQPEIQFDLSLISNSNEKIPLVINPGFKYTHINDQGDNLLTIDLGNNVRIANVYLDLKNAAFEKLRSYFYSFLIDGIICTNTINLVY